MTTENNIIDLKLLDHTRFKSWSFLQDTCVTCGLCSSSCPVSGVDDFDPRKMVRMASMGMEEELIGSRWPWICTLCGKCEAVCPMEISIPDMARKIRSLRDRDKVPGILHKGLSMALKTGNNLGLPDDDFQFIIEDVAEEVAAEPGFKNFKAPIDKKGANLLITIHNKLVNTHTEDLKHWWKILHAAKEDWTIPSDNWEGCNWGLFTGDEPAEKEMVGRIADHMKRLGIKNLLWPE